MRVALADDAVLFREGIARVLTERGFEVVVQAGNAEELLEAVETRSPTSSLSTSGCRPRTRTKGCWRRCRSATRTPTIGVLMLSQYIETHYAMQLLADRPAGAGYLLRIACRTSPSSRRR